MDKQQEQQKFYLAVSCWLENGSLDFLDDRICRVGTDRMGLAGVSRACMRPVPGVCRSLPVRRPATAVWTLGAPPPMASTCACARNLETQLAD